MRLSRGVSIESPIPAGEGCGGHDCRGPVLRLRPRLAPSSVSRFGTLVTNHGSPKIRTSSNLKRLVCSSEPTAGPFVKKHQNRKKKTRKKKNSVPRRHPPASQRPSYSWLTSTCDLIKLLHVIFSSTSEPASFKCIFQVFSHFAVLTNTTRLDC